MDLNALVSIQRDFDSEHGWVPSSTEGEDILPFLTRDLIGLFGEMGEFANAVKKVQLSDAGEVNAALRLFKPALSEELVDFLIYVIRFAGYLEVDLETEYLNKLEANKQRFQRFLLVGDKSDEST